MLVEWKLGAGHGLVWGHGLAVVAPGVGAAAARRLWGEFAAGGDLAEFLRVLSAETDADLLALPPFAVALRTEHGGWQVAARGNLEATVDGEIVRGADISTWTERFLAGGARVTVGAAGDADAAEGLPLVGGVVPAVSLTWDAAAASEIEGDGVRARVARVDAVPAVAEGAADAAPEVEADADADDAPEPDAVDVDEAESRPDADVPDDAPDALDATDARSSAADQATLIGDEPSAEVAAEPGRFASQFGETRSWSPEDAAVRPPAEFIASVPTSATAASGAPASGLAASAPQSVGIPHPADAPADVPANAPYDASSDPAEAFDEGDHDGMTMVASEPPRPAVPDEPEPQPQAGGVRTVLGVECPAGHANPPQRSACSVCGEPLDAEPRQVPRPSLGVLLLPNGERVDITVPLIVGRNPRAERVQGSVLPRLIPLSQSHVSSTHLEIRLEEWNVLAVDMASTNGTFLRRHGQAPVRLGERPELLVEGDVLDLGHGVQLTLEHLR